MFVGLSTKISLQRSDKRDLWLQILFLGVFSRVFQSGEQGGENSRKWDKEAAATAKFGSTVMAHKPRGLPRGIHPEDIAATLRKKWGTLAAFARHIGRTANAVSNTIRQPGYSVPIEKEIAGELDMGPHEVWPDRYKGDGTPVSFRDVRILSQNHSADPRRSGAAA
ncbi:helix-turn-helix domain-containing protein [Asaia sp. HN010]|uniref:helix-turn-helix domain-containing protein n=1 Tax=Asaia sp. HN010 TaxID=3081233 RepID=UPI003018C3FE